MREPDPRLDRRVGLPDGRELGYADLGDPEGLPVLYFHGTPSSRLDAAAFEHAVAPLGLRLLSFDRPGIGLSSPASRPGFVGGAGDAVTLLDELGVAEAIVFGYSGGGPHAIALATSAPERVARLVLVSSCGPPDRPHAGDGMHPVEAGLDWLTDRLPLASRAVFGGLARFMALAPALSGRLMHEGLAGGSREAAASLAASGLQLVDPYLEAFRQGSVGAIADYRLLLRPWDVDPGTVTVPTELWHGQRDDAVPFHQSVHLAAEIPDARLELVPRGRHGMVYHLVGEVLAAASAGLRG